MASSRICSIEGCGKPHSSRGWCRHHYNRWHLHGDPNPPNVRPCIRDGKNQHPLFRIWVGIHSRCENRNYKEFALYGGRGVSVCERWHGSEGFWNFVTDMGPRPSLKHSIDRYPNLNGNYEVGNCRWATSRQQCRNMRNNRFVDGKLVLELEESMKCKISHAAVLNRLSRGWSAHDALTKPLYWKKGRK